MGTTPPSLPSQTLLNPNVQPLTKIEQYKNLILWAHPTARLFEHHKIFIQTKNSSQQALLPYKQRQIQHPNIIAVHSYQIINRQFEDSGYLQLELFIDRIPIKLNQIQLLPFEDGLFVLKQAVEGFNTLMEKVGFFYINDSLIGFDCQNNVKVWINNNWALNTKLKPVNKRNQDTTEHQMVKSIIHTIESHIQLSKILTFWLKQVEKQQQWSFKKLKEFVLKFSQNNSILIKNKLILHPNKMVYLSDGAKQLSFKPKSMSPQQVILYRSLSKDVKQQADILNFPIKKSKKSKSRLFAEDPMMTISKPPEVFSFKSKKDKTAKEKMRVSYLNSSTRSGYMPPRRHSEFVQSSFQSYKNKQNKRIVFNKNQDKQYFQKKQPAFLQQDKSQVYVIKVSNVSPPSKQNPSLQNIRKQLRDYLEGRQENQYRSSCPVLNCSNRDKNSPDKQKKQLQFKNTNMRKKRKTKTTRVILPSEDTLSFNKQFLEKRSLFRSNCKYNKDNKYNEYNKQLHRDTSLDQTRSISNVALHNTQGIIQSQTQNSLASIEIVNNLKTKNTVPVSLGIPSKLVSFNTNNVDNSMTNETKPSASTMTLLSKVKHLWQSQTFEENSAELKPPKESNRSKSLSSMKNKAILTHSIIIPSTKSKQSKQSKKIDANRPLSVLQMLLRQKNLQKSKESLDVSLDIIDNEGMKNSIVQLDEQCDS